jgi:hypothetical protein
MRLIDADALIEAFKVKSGIWTETSKYLIKVIEKQPTAYDVDAVVKKLEEAKKKNFESYKEATDTLDIICYGNAVNAYGDAISVVKAGGIE